MIHIVYHITVIILSAAAALSLPFTMRYAAQKFLVYWAFVENEKIFLVAVEIVVAVMFILFFEAIERFWKGRRISAMASAAGLEAGGLSHGTISRKRLKKFKEKQGIARDVMIMGSTGYRTFVPPKGELHRVLEDCREARLLLLNPVSEGAYARAASIKNPGITPETFREQIHATIGYLKGLWASKKNIRLKLYQDVPLLKMIILGDFMYVKHYHPGTNVSEMPEFVFSHKQKVGGLYHPLYQFFLTRWHDPSIPEYDFATDEFVYRDWAGKETRRENFGMNTVIAPI
jgi:hypothetical protein